MRSFKSTRLSVFCYLLGAGGLFYLVDCLVSFKEHPDLPWFETGIYAPSPAGFLLTIVFIVAAFGYLIFGQEK